MKLHDVEMYRAEKEHHMKHGHLSAEDREELAQHKLPHRYGFLDKEDKQYHSPERPMTMEGEY